jgi:hypothetical protein
VTHHAAAETTQPVDNARRTTNARADERSKLCETASCERSSRELAQGRLGVREEVLAEQQILGRVAREREPGKQHHIGACLARGAATVRVRVAVDRVERAMRGS